MHEHRGKKILKIELNIVYTEGHDHVDIFQRCKGGFH